MAKLLTKYHIYCSLLKMNFIYEYLRILNVCYVYVCAVSGAAVAVAVPGLPGGEPSNLLSLFECPVCFDYALPPIKQCPSGHIVCSSCRKKLQSCPTCRGPLGKFYTINLFCSVGIPYLIKYLSYCWVIL